MQAHQVREPGQALAYITDCNLATVSDMARKKSRAKSEYERQIGIAQRGVDWLVAMKVDVAGTRAVEVIAAGGVAAWAQKYLPA